MSRHPVALTLGVAVAVVGIAAALAPSLLAPLPAAETLVGGVGAVAVVYALVTLSGRRGADRRQAPDPEPERRPTVRPPGDDLDRLLAVAGSTDAGSDDRRHRLRRQLRNAAVRSVRRREGCDVETARVAVETGSWTDDPVAASYFTDGPVELPEADLGLTDRLRYRVSERERRELAARRVADEVAAAAEVGG